MILKAIMCAQHFCSFGAMLFIVNLLIKTDSTVICVPCMLEHVRYEPFSLKSCRSGRYLILITLCMKLSWFCHTNSGQLFCNCPLFVIALVPGLFFGGKPDETCCDSVVASKWLETRVSHFALQDENTTT